jgi:hypothetical protein
MYSVTTCVSLKNHLMVAYLDQNILWINKVICFCDGNYSIFNCKHHKMDATL